MSEDSSAPLLITEGTTAIVTLRRPAHANRLQQEDVFQLRSCWDRLRQGTTIRAVVLTSTGRYFSAGYDINSMPDISRSDHDGEVVENAFASMVDELEQLPQVTICALNGGVYGGATDLALACDFRYGVPACQMFIPAARLGLQYYLSGLRRYASRLGVDNAKRLFLLAEKLDAEQMLAIGYLHRIIHPNELLPQALQTARQVEGLAPLAISGMKAALNAIAKGCVDERAIRLAEARTLSSNDIREGLMAWRDKRSPLFAGA